VCAAPRFAPAATIIFNPSPRFSCRHKGLLDSIGLNFKDRSQFDCIDSHPDLRQTRSMFRDSMPVKCLLAVRT
jgi:hypothetical protein